MNTQVERLVARYEADINDVRSKLNELGRIHDEMKRKTEEAAGRSQKHANESLTALNSIRSRATLVAASVTGLFGAATSSALVALGNEATQLENQMRGFGVATDEARRKVYEMAMETRTPIQATVGLLRSMSNALKDQDFETTLRQVGTLNRLLTTGGLDQGQRGSVILQFGQALQSGTLSGDELRALRESAPYELLEAIAKQAGSTVDQLRKLGAEGKITTDIMVGALNDLEQVSRDKFGDFNMTIGEAMSVMQTGMIAAAGEIEKSWGMVEGLSGVIGAVGRAFADNTEAVGAFAEALKVVTQLALIAASARGIGIVVPALASLRVSSLTAAIAVAQLQRGLGGLLGLLGGPMGVALFAAGTAALFLARRMEDTEERLENAKSATDEFVASQEKLADLRNQRSTLSNQLTEAEERLETAIADQGITAATTARIEVEGVRRRIEAVESLIAIEARLAEQRRKDAVDELQTAQNSLAATSRAGLSAAYMATGDRSYLEVLSTTDTDLLIRTYEQYLTKKDELTAREERQLDLIAKLRNQEISTNEALAGSNVEAFAAHTAAWEAYLNDLEKKTAEIVQKTGERAAKIKALEEQRAAIPRLVSAGRLTEQEGFLNTRALDDQIAKLTDADGRVSELRQELESLRKATAGAFQFDPTGEGANALKFMDALLQTAEQRIDEVDNAELDNLTAAFENVSGIVQTVLDRLGLIPGAIGGIGQAALDLNRFPNPYENDLANDSANKAAIGAMAQDMVEYIKRAELFRAEPYWDQNHWRVGYGTDKVYDDAGRPQVVTQSTRVNEQQADYALMRRLAEDFIPPIIRAVGQDRWGAMSDQQRTALASLSYNYGGGAWTNPETLGRVADAVRTGSQQGVANSIASLASQGPFREDGTPVNRERRLEEAAMWGPLNTGQEAEFAAQEKAREEQRRADEERQERIDNYLKSMRDQNELLQLREAIAGKDLRTQEELLMIHERQQAAIAAGLNLSDIDPLNGKLTVQQAIEDSVRREMELRETGAIAEEIQNQRREDLMEQERQAQERLNEIKNNQLRVEQDINGLIMAAITQTDSLKDAVGRVIAKWGEMMLQAALFGGQGGGGGILGGLTGAIGGIVGGWFSAKGNVMTEYGPMKLNKYSKGGIAYRPQLSIFGEGSTPEAYVPLPDGRTIPVTLRMPDVPTPGVNSGGGLMRMVIELNNEMLHGKIVESSAPVAAAISERNVERFSRNQMPSRVRQIDADPKRI